MMKENPVALSRTILKNIIGNFYVRGGEVCL